MTRDGRNVEHAVFLRLCICVSQHRSLPVGFLLSRGASSCYLAVASISMPSLHHRQAAAELTAGRGDSSGRPTAAAAGPGGAGAAVRLAGGNERGMMTIKVRLVWALCKRVVCKGNAVRMQFREAVSGRGIACSDLRATLSGEPWLFRFYRAGCCLSACIR